MPYKCYDTCIIQADKLEFELRSNLYKTTEERCFTFYLNMLFAINQARVVMTLGIKILINT